VPLEPAAAQVGVRATGLRRLSAPGTLPASPGRPSGPWLLHASALPLLAGQTAVRASPGGRRPAGRRRPGGASAGGDGESQAAGRRAVLAAVPLARLQKPIGRWWAADAKRPRGRRARGHPELGAALPSAKGNLRPRLRRLAPQGWSLMTRPPGGKTASVSLTVAGRQQALKRAGSDEEGGTIQKNHGLCTDHLQRSDATLSAGGKRARSKSTRTTILSLGATERRVGGYTGPVAA
jgi:hypothetical protein